MSEELHPAWCARKVCTAYGTAADEYHRSEPFVIQTDDPWVDLFIFKVADADGANEFIEMTELERGTGQPWHLREPLRGMLLPRASADAAWRAVAELV
ncbi:hypothetical protein GCM10010399_52110 [Dactylosporangium fulvum]|uniref:Uncharacterized protein n=1 Tax=Dactylosporangium fulvum TaxID=53359 RepID=A0ABY5VVR3_9ACTN|nr:hypothetical protein [Dactylosporangium fulvum]UWP81260.1 hypothetical protein Dfulv_40070 [Dactylosporangium fulvum]